MPPVWLSAVLLGLVTWLAEPVLRHFDGALIPWPAHALGFAIIFASPRTRRVDVSAAMMLAVTLGALLAGGTLLRAVAAAAQLIAQSIVVLMLYERVSDGRHPLRGTNPYARYMGSVVIGVIPTTVVASAILLAVGSDVVPGFSPVTYWVAAASSLAALGPVVLVPTTPAVVLDRQQRLDSWEFALLLVVYLAALLNAFFLVGNDLIPLPAALTSLPFLMWAGLRFGVRGFAVAAALFITIAVASAIMSIGPFSIFGDTVLARGRRAWVYVAALVGPAMLFPVALAERLAIESRARSAFAQLAAIIRGSGDLIAAVDRDLRIIALNPTWVDEFERITGVRAQTGMDMAEALRGLPADVDESLAFWQRALNGERFTVTREIGDPTRTRSEYEITYGPVRDEQEQVVGASQVVRNVSVRRKREAEEADARRLESVGRLAGGVAHDFNNLMTAVIGYTEIVQQSLPSGDPRQDDLREIEKAASRAGVLTQQLLAFARQRMVEPKIVNLAALVEGLTGLLRPLLGPGVQLAVRTEATLPPVRLDPAQFEQVLMNLAVNARDAMPGGGRLDIELANERRGERHGVRLIARDSGTGMTAEVMQRLWEPFFTTKPLGKGTGLGLPTVHGIVHQAGGEISVESTPGSGTTFHVFLPAASAAAE